MDFIKVCVPYPEYGPWEKKVSREEIEAACKAPLYGAEENFPLSVVDFCNPYDLEEYNDPDFWEKCDPEDLTADLTFDFIVGVRSLAKIRDDENKRYKKMRAEKEKHISLDKSDPEVWWMDSTGEKKTNEICCEECGCIFYSKSHWSGDVFCPICGTDDMLRVVGTISVDKSE